MQPLLFSACFPAQPAHRKQLALPLGECNGTGGASRQAVAKAVAVIVPQQLGFAVDKADGSLGRQAVTQAPLAIAFLLRLCE